MSVPNQLFSNNATSLLAAPISQIATSLTVMAGYGRLFPQPVDPGDYFLVTLENQAGNAREILKVGGRSGDTFTNILRAQEGTAAQMWTASMGDDTLVDHRVTAETMRQALMQPTGTTGISGVNIEDHGLAVQPAAVTLNFIGNVAVIDNGTSKDIDIGALVQPAIHGETVTTPVPVPVGGTIGVNEGTYSQYSRGFKFYVTLYQPTTFRSASFEVMANVSGNLSTNLETASFSRYGRVGYNFAGNVVISLNTALKRISLAWENLETTPVEAMSIRIQHLG
jgi:hypothetical protein